MRVRVVSGTEIGAVLVVVVSETEAVVRAKIAHLAGEVRVVDVKADKGGGG